MDTRVRADAEINLFIDKRAKERQREEANAREAEYMENTRRHHERKREENRRQWYLHHLRQAHSHDQLAEQHRADALKCCDKGRWN